MLKSNNKHKFLNFFIIIQFLLLDKNELNVQLN